MTASTILEQFSISMQQNLSTVEQVRAALTVLAQQLLPTASVNWHDLPSGCMLSCFCLRCVLLSSCASLLQHLSQLVCK